MQIGRHRDQKLRGFGDIDPRERAARWTLWRINGLGYRRMARLVDETDGRLAQLFEMSERERHRLLEQADVTPKLVERILATIEGEGPGARLEREIDALPAKTSIVHLGEHDYPSRLLDLDEPPVFLYVRGSITWLAHLRTVAIVGSRKATVTGVRLARSIAHQLAHAGVVVISGGALGVDAAAHRGCLDGGSPTVAVLAGGVDRPTPRRNAAVFEATIDLGAIVSEYPIATKPRRFYFHRRNELIAALGDTTLVVRAAKESGTMITARAARSLDRPLCALPGALDDPLAQGCHELLVDGARCVRGADDILERVLAMPPRPSQLTLETSSRPRKPQFPSPQASNREAAKACPRVARAELSEDGAELLDALGELAGRGRDGVALDQLKRDLQWPATRLNPALLELELVGAVAKRAGANVFRPL